MEAESNNNDDNHSPSARSGLSSLYKQASQASRILVISRVSNRKVLPWMVSAAGAIRCFDTVSLSRKLSLHRHAMVPILLHVFLWDRGANYANVGSIRARAMSTLTQSLPSDQAHVGDENQVVPLDMEDELDDYVIRVSHDCPDITLERDSVGDFSFRLRDFALTDNWVWCGLLLLFFFFGIWFFMYIKRYTVFVHIVSSAGIGLHGCWFGVAICNIPIINLHIEYSVTIFTFFF